jgi:hypothetical protein
MRTLFGIADRVPDISMAPKILNEPGIQTPVNQHVAGRMPQHVRVNMKSDAGRLGSLGDDPDNHVDVNRPAALAYEHERSISDLPLPS